MSSGRVCLSSMSIPRTLTAAVHQEDDWYVAQCLEVDVASQGPTIEEALANLREAVALYLDEVDEPNDHVTGTPMVTSFEVFGEPLNRINRPGPRAAAQGRREPAAP